MGHLEEVVGEKHLKTCVAEVGERRTQEQAQLHGVWAQGDQQGFCPVTPHMGRAAAPGEHRAVLLTRSLTNFQPQQFEAILLRTILLQAPQLLPGSGRTFCSMVLPAAFHAEPRNASSSLCPLESSPRQAHPELALSVPCSTEVC